MRRPPTDTRYAAKNTGGHEGRSAAQTAPTRRQQVACREPRPRRCSLRRDSADARGALSRCGGATRSAFRVRMAGTMQVHLSPSRRSTREYAAHRGSRDVRANSRGRAAQPGRSAAGGRVISGGRARAARSGCDALRPDRRPAATSGRARRRAPGRNRRRLRRRRAPGSPSRSPGTPSSALRP